MAEQKRTQQFWSDLDPSNKFTSFKEADEHDRRLQQSKMAKESINKFNRVAPQMDAAKMGGTDYMTAPKDQIQSQAEGEVLNEMYGGKRTALAKGYGLGANESPEAKRFMASEAARQLAAQLKAGGKQYGVLSSVLEAVADGADVESINKILGTNLGSVGLENVEQVGRVDLQEDKQRFEAGQNDLDREQRVLDRAVRAAEEKNVKDKFKTDQYKVATFAVRIKQTQEVLDELDRKGFNPASFKNILMGKEGAVAIRDPNARKYAQAMRNFVNATLRRESGAAIAESEFDSAYKQYFSEFNDDAEVLAQKRNSRLAIMAGFMMEAGGAYDEVSQKYNSLRGESGDKPDPLGIR